MRGISSRITVFMCSSFCLCNSTLLYRTTNQNTILLKNPLGHLYAWVTKAPCCLTPLKTRVIRRGNYYLSKKNDPRWQRARLLVCTGHDIYYIYLTIMLYPLSFPSNINHSTTTENIADISSYQHL